MCYKIYLEVKMEKTIEIYAKDILKREVGHLFARRRKEEQLQIDSFGVRAKWRRKGVGKKIIEYLKEYAKEKGISSIVVFPGPCNRYDEDITLSIEEQICIYKKLGFQFTDKNREILTFEINKGLLYIDK